MPYFDNTHAPAPVRTLSVQDRTLVKHKAVWGVVDEATKKKFFIKRATPSEVAITKRLADFSLPEDRVLVLPKIPFGPNQLPEALRKEVSEWEDAYNKNVSNRRSAILITEAHPVSDAPATLVNDELESALQNKPIRESEFDRLVRDIKTLNDAGIYNHDFMSNLFPQRDAKGQVKFYAIDFEPETFEKLHPGEHEDVAQVSRMRKELRKRGALAPDDFKGTIAEAKALAQPVQETPSKRPLPFGLGKIKNAFRLNL